MRSCGSCTLCCKVLGVPTLGKPANKWCEHCDNKGSCCTIYEDRPQECRDFQCLWLMRDVVPHELKPSKSRVVLVTSTDGRGITALCDPNMPLAWKKPSTFAYLQEISKRVTVVVDAGSRAWQIKPIGYRELRPEEIRRSSVQNGFLVQA